MVYIHEYTQGMESLIGNVLDDIEEFEAAQEQLGIEPETIKLKQEVLQNLNDPIPSKNIPAKPNKTKSKIKPNSPKTKKSTKTKRSKSTSIDDHTVDHTPSLPLSTTKPAKDTQIAFITHYRHSEPQITVQPVSQNTYTVYHKHHQASNDNTQFNYPVHNKNHYPVQYKLFSPNPFYPGQSLPILVQVAPNTNVNVNMPQQNQHQNQQRRPVLQSTALSAQSRNSVRSVGSLVGGMQQMQHANSSPMMMSQQRHSLHINASARSPLGHAQSNPGLYYSLPANGQFNHTSPVPKVPQKRKIQLNPVCL